MLVSIMHQHLHNEKNKIKIKIKTILKKNFIRRN